MEVTPEEIVLIGGLSSKSVHQNYWAIIFPKLSWVLEISLHHFLVFRFVHYKQSINEEMRITFLEDSG